MQKRQVGGGGGGGGGGGAREPSPLAALDKLSRPRIAALGADMDAARARRSLWRWRLPLALFAALVLVAWTNSRWLAATAPAKPATATDAASTLRAATATLSSSTTTTTTTGSSSAAAALSSLSTTTKEEVKDDDDVDAWSPASDDQLVEDFADDIAAPALERPLVEADSAAAGASTQAEIKVCAVANNPRQGSIFRTNLMGLIGSGRYEYEVKKHGQCALTVPRVRMVPYVKCCTDMAVVQKTIASSFKQYDIVIVTGDEYCAVRSTQFHYRQYYGDDVIGTGMVSKLRSLRLPLYFPLGPRAEFQRVDQVSGVPSVAARQYALNFVGSPTSVSRRRLRDFFQSTAWTSNPLSKTSFIHVTDSWTQTVSEAMGYISPERYREVLLDSMFTLCPMGHNPEAYRIYEACEAGSVPVLVTGEEEYVNHKCSNAFKPLLDAGAPFVVLDSWDELPALLETITTNRTFAVEKQTAVRRWYAEYMSAFAREFEEMLELRYKLRVGKALR